MKDTPAKVAVMRQLLIDYETARDKGVPRDAQNAAYQMLHLVSALHGAAYLAESRRARGEGKAL